MTMVVGDNLNSSTSLKAVRIVSLNHHLTESGWNGLPDARICGTKICKISSVTVNMGEDGASIC